MGDRTIVFMAFLNEVNEEEPHLAWGFYVGL
jgi:hypothetical protein